MSPLAEGGAYGTLLVVSESLIGYIRCSTDDQDLTAQREALVALGVAPERVYVDQGLTGTNRDRPGLHNALGACRSGGTLVVTKLDRLARSVPDARAIADELTASSVKLSLGGAVYHPLDPGRATSLQRAGDGRSEFEGDFAGARTREGMRIAKAKGRLRGKQPTLSPKRKAHLLALHGAGRYTIGELEELFEVTRSTVYGAANPDDRHLFPRRCLVGGCSRPVRVCRPWATQP